MNCPICKGEAPCKKCMVAGVAAVAAIIVIAALLLMQKGAPCETTCETGETCPLECGDAGKDCRAGSECESGICDYYKQDMGKCAPVACTTGTQAQDMGGYMAYYCGADGSWKATLGENAACTETYQCGRRTCKDASGCVYSDMGRTSVACEGGVCKWTVAQDACEAQGMVRIIDKSEYAWQYNDSADCERLIFSVEIRQSDYKTVCAPCGNGMCDQLEDNCNCPEDCSQPSGQPVFDDSWQVCSSDSDCKRVDAGCCGCTSGGAARSINKVYEAAWSARVGRECAATSCIAMMSNDPSCFAEPKCISGECELSGAGSGGTSGITGTILLGPTCPVIRNPPDPACADRPYKATVIVRSEDGSREITRFTSGEDGTFRAELAPGTYLLDPQTPVGSMLPRGSQETVAVISGAFAEVNISYDSGIR